MLLSVSSREVSAVSRTVRHIVRGMRSRERRNAVESGAGKGADLRLMRELNRRLILNCVRERGPIARVAIARQTGLSRTTVGTIVDDLLNDGLVREGATQTAARSGGRPAILVHFNASAGSILGLDMGRSHLTILLSDLAANILARRSGPFDASLGPDECLPWVVRELRDFLVEQHVSWNRVVGIGVGMPGPMDANVHRTIAPPRMPGWGNVDVGGRLSRELGVPVYVDNDANMGALGESWYGAGSGVRDLIYIKIGTGIGAGLITSGHIYRGSRGSAGEIGHVTFDESGPVCDCGNRGCLETFASAPAIVEDAIHAASLRAADPLASATALPALANTPHPDIADVVQAARDGDCACVAALRRAGERIGIVVAGLVNLINPSAILIGGGVAQAGGLLLDPIRSAVNARTFSVASQDLRIEQGALGDNAVGYGGIATVIDAAFGVTSTSASGRALGVGTKVAEIDAARGETGGDFTPGVSTLLTHAAAAPPAAVEDSS